MAHRPIAVLPISRRRQVPNIDTPYHSGCYYLKQTVAINVADAYARSGCETHLLGETRDKLTIT